jgi:4-diphosphocytidyl-2C-methyl-D-erythritol kinase
VTPQLVRDNARNDLLAAAERLCPAVADARSRAAGRGIALALSGSGPTLFAVADDRRDALRIARILRRLGLAAHAHTIAG